MELGLEVIDNDDPLKVKQENRYMNIELQKYHSRADGNQKGGEKVGSGSPIYNSKLAVLRDYTGKKI